MKQILQSLGTGATVLLDVPIPAPSPRSLVLESRASLVSTGTERMLLDFGRSNLIEKARSQPDKVRQVLQKVRTDGLATTLEAVRAKLDEPIPLGYCNAGVVREIGRDVRGFTVGDRVVSNGPHAEYVRVPWTLAARIPDNVSFEASAFTPVAAIGLQGLRLAAPTLGETVVVYGLGLIGLLTAQLARAAGCRVIGIDRVPDRLALARTFGADVLGGDVADLPAGVRELTGGIGADAVVLTLATDSDEPMHLAAEMSRKRGRLVLVGVTGLSLRREDFYKKELSFQVSCSYGPGRYDPSHEDAGIDYPLGHVRWTEGRNFAAVLDLMASGRLDPLPLISHRYPLSDAAAAYDTVASANGSLGIVFTYPEQPTTDSAKGRTIALQIAPTPRQKGTVGCIGAGNFASRMLVPAFAKAGAVLHTIVSPGGTSAAVVGRTHGFKQASSDASLMLATQDIDTILVATRHDSHARLTVDALRAGKHVFVEKPLALDMDQLEQVRDAAATSGGLLCVGFNRRMAPLTQRAKEAIAGRVGPLAVVITVNAGMLPAEHWTKDPSIGGGRIIGEGCHFIDLARYFVGSPIVDLQVATATSSGTGRAEDISLLQLTFADGSVASINYLANGNRGFPKERVELFWDSRTLQIDNYLRMHGWGAKGTSARIGARQDKGHAALAAAFLGAVRRGTPAPIPVEELFEVSEWSIRAGHLAMRREGA